MFSEAELKRSTSAERSPSSTSPTITRFVFPYRKFHWQNGKSLVPQLLGLILVWTYVVVLHFNNDGLWFQGDAPRHAANGLFWWDFLSSFSVHPVEFALSYYARYPVIHPTAYPPLFYVVEGFVFFLLGASLYVFMMLVSVFALMAGAYLIAWLRRWVAPEAGWGGLLLILQPGVITWSNAVMLNIPSMAISLAALYHTRRWIEFPASRHIYLVGIFALMGILTYFPGAVVVPIIIVWIFAERWREVLRDRRVWILLLLSIVLLLPVGLIVKQWAPRYVSVALSLFRMAGRPDRWTYYLDRMYENLSPLLLWLALLGLALGVVNKAWRKEMQYLLIWSVICYAVFSSIWVREARYVLLIVPAAVISAVVGILCLSRWYGAVFNRSGCAFYIPALGLLVLFHLSMARTVQFPNIKGFETLVGFLQKAAPQARLFYDGKYDGIFSFYVRAGDPNFERGVVLGDKLLYAVRFIRGEAMEYANSPPEVVKILQTKCGCQWLVVEKNGASDWI